VTDKDSNGVWSGWVDYNIDETTGSCPCEDYLPSSFQLQQQMQILELQKEKLDKKITGEN